MKRRIPVLLATFVFGLFGCAGKVVDASGGDVPATDTGTSEPARDGAPPDAAPMLTENPCLGTSPVALVASADAARSVATDGSSVFWTTWPTARSKGKVLTASLAARTPVVLADAEDEPTEIAVDAGRVYWVDHARSLRAVDASGGSAFTVYDGAVTLLAVGGEHVVFTSGDAIVLEPPGGGAPEVIVASARADALAVDADAVYWVRTDGSASVHRHRFADGRDETLALGLGVTTHTSLAVDATNVWVASMDGGMLWKIGLADARTAVAATGLSCPDTLRADGTSVFLANSAVACRPSLDLAARAILQYSAADARPTAIGVAPAETTGIDGRFAIDARNVYWAGRYGAQSYVYCVAKR